MSDNFIEINGKRIGPGYPCYIIAELSCNHCGSYETALECVKQAHKSGADAIKLQTYKGDTITIDCDDELFKIKNTGLWDGQTLYSLYNKSHTPWEWHEPLKKEAEKLGMDLFSSPFDVTAVDFLEGLNVPAYKIASCEITDHVLIRKIASTGKPVIISSGMASATELQEAVDLLRKYGKGQKIVMLKCTAAYPANPADANLITIQDMIKRFDVIGGLSDHTLGHEVPVTSISMGASIIEKHYTLSRQSGSADDAFSLEPDEFKAMIEAVRTAEKVIGKVTYGCEAEAGMKEIRRSLFVTEDVKAGEAFNEKNVRSIRPNAGCHTKHYWDIVGKTSKQDLKKGTPMNMDYVQGG